jgi:predicted O-methyltransferase YrrM
MNSPNASLLASLEAHGAAHDEQTEDRAERLLNITRDTGQFLSVLVRASRAKRILEIGTSNAYSTIWLAEAAHATGGEVTSVERLPAKAALARATLASAIDIAPVTLEVVEGGDFLERTIDESWDFIFLDSDRTHYAEWWPYIRRALTVGGLLVVDNSTSHAHEVAPLAAALAAAPEFTTVLVPIGKGELVAHKGAA